MFGKNTRRGNKIHCAECGSVFRERDLKVERQKHRDERLTEIIVMEIYCPNCNHRIDSYEDTSQNARRNRRGVGWSPPR